MSTSAQHQLLLAAIAGLMFFVNLGGAHLWDEDEAIFSQVSKEMLARGDHVVPYFNGEMFPHKPAMMYWLQIAAYEVFGPTELAARFWSAALGICCVLVTYHLGSLIFSPAAGFWSGLVLASNMSFNVIARAATPDSILTFFSTLSVLLFVLGTAKSRVPSSAPNERNAPWAGQTRFEPSWMTYAFVYAAMGCGVLTKGPIGVVLPTAVIGLFLLLARAKPIEVARQGGWRGMLANAWRRTARVLAVNHVARTIWSMRPITAIAVVLAVAGPWYVLVGLKTDGRWLADFFGVHNFGRFLGAMENHRGPIVYYLAVIAVGFFPWSVLLGPSLRSMKRELDEGQPWRPGYLLVCAWFAVWVGFFSLAGTKLPSYVVPAYPALALATGAFVDRWLREPAAVSRVWNRMLWGTVALGGVALLVGLPIAAHRYLHDDWMLGAVGLIPLVGAILGWALGEQQRVRAAMSTLAVVGVALAVAVFGFGAAYVDRYQESPRLAQAITDHTPSGQQPTIGAFHYFRPSFVFYTDCPIEQFASADEVRAFFESHPGVAFVIATDESYKQLGPHLPEDVTILDSGPRFLRPGQSLLLGRAEPQATTAAKTTPAAGSSRQ